MEVNFSIEEFATKYAKELNSLSGFPFKHFDLIVGPAFMLVLILAAVIIDRRRNKWKK